MAVLGSRRSEQGGGGILTILQEAQGCAPIRVKKMNSKHEEWIEDHCIEHYELRDQSDMTEEQLIESLTNAESHNQMYFRDRTQETILVSDVREYLEKLDQEFRNNRLRLVSSRND